MAIIKIKKIKIEKAVVFCENIFWLSPLAPGSKLAHCELLYSFVLWGGGGGDVWILKSNRPLIMCVCCHCAILERTLKAVTVASPA